MLSLTDKACPLSFLISLCFLMNKFALHGIFAMMYCLSGAQNYEARETLLLEGGFLRYFVTMMEKQQSYSQGKQIQGYGGFPSVSDEGQCV